MLSVNQQDQSWQLENWNLKRSSFFLSRVAHAAMIGKPVYYLDGKYG